MCSCALSRVGLCVEGDLKVLFVEGAVGRQAANTELARFPDYRIAFAMLTFAFVVVS